MVLLWVPLLMLRQCHHSPKYWMPPGTPKHPYLFLASLLHTSPCLLHIIARPVVLHYSFKMSFALVPFCSNSTSSDGAPPHTVIGTEGTREELTSDPCIVLTMSGRPGQGARKEYQQLLYVYRGGR